MKLLLLAPVFCLMASCVGTRTMTVVSRSPEGITVAADWREYSSFATNSADNARRWFAREATRLARAEGKPVKAVRLQSATLKFQAFPGICIATLRGAAIFGQKSPAGIACHDGSSMMTQAATEDRKVQQRLVTRGALGAGGDIAALRAAQLDNQRMHTMSMPRHTSRPASTGIAESSRKTDARPSSGPATGSSQWSGSPFGSSTGATSKKEGDTWIHSKGVTSTRRGNVVYNSDGTSYTIAADGTMYLNGKGL
jgi:hypothetical protein